MSNESSPVPVKSEPNKRGCTREHVFAARVQAADSHGLPGRYSKAAIG